MSHLSILLQLDLRDLQHTSKQEADVYRRGHCGREPENGELQPALRMFCSCAAALLLSFLVASPIMAQEAASASASADCGRVPATPTPLETTVDGLTWEPMAEAIPVLVSPSPEQRAYLTAIDEVHAHLRLDGSRIGMAMIMYDICDIDAPALQSRLSAIRVDLDQAAEVLAGLRAPDHLAAVHRNYQQVVRLYQQGLVEMDLTVQDGDAGHLRDAFPFTTTASDGLAQLEALVWGPPLLESTHTKGPASSANAESP